MQLADIARYLRELTQEVHVDALSIAEARKLLPQRWDIRSPEAQLALIKKLAEHASSNDKSPLARALLHLLESECGLIRPIILNSVLDAKISAAA